MANFKLTEQNLLDVAEKLTEARANLSEVSHILNGRITVRLVGQSLKTDSRLAALAISLGTEAERHHRHWQDAIAALDGTGNRKARL